MSERSIPVRLQDLRMAMGWQLSDIAKEFGVSPSAICLWEQGERTPRGSSLIILKTLEEKHADKLLELEKRRPVVPAPPDTA